jgi:outer membrane protein assembly complex protein YaeT
VKRIGAAALFVLVLCTWVPALWAGQPEASLYGRPIVSIGFDPEQQPIPPEQIRISLQLRPGDRLDEAELGQAIERLFATGRYEDIVVSGETAPNGVAVTFHTKSKYFLSHISAEGTMPPPTGEQLVSASALNLGDDFDEEALATAATQMQTMLRANGFYGSTIRYETAKRDTAQQMDVRFIVEPGHRARFATPVIEGDPKFKASRILRMTGWPNPFSLHSWFRGGALREWREVTDARVQRGLEKVRNGYIKKGFLMAGVHLSELVHNEANDTVTPHLKIDAGPKVTVRAEGAHVSQGTLKRVLPIFQERSIDSGLLSEGVGSLQDYFTGEGYFDAKVTYSMKPSGNGTDQTIVYQVTRGPRSRFTRIELQGHKYFDEPTIRERMSLMPASMFRSRRGRFSVPLLDRDVQSIQELYRSNGFRDVKVVPRVIRGDKGKPHDVAVVVKIEEGPQILVGDLELSGVDLKLVDEVTALITSRAGQPYSTSNVAMDRDAVLGYYFNNGYPEAIFDTQIKRGVDDAHVNLKYLVNEGRRLFARGVLVNGLRTTRPGLVSRRLTIQPGDPLSQSAIVETQRRLYDLGIFSTVDIAVQNPDGIERSKYVVLQADEARRYTLNLGFGAEIGRIGGSATSFDAPAGSAGFSPRALIGVSRLNMFGLGHTASVTGRVSTIQQRVLAGYLAPQFQGNDSLSLSFSQLFDRSSDIRTFTSQRFESSVQLSKKLSRSSLLEYRASIRQVSIDSGTLKISPALIPIYSVPVRTTILSATLIQDRRDDPMDSTRGVFNTVDFGVAPPMFTSGTYYTRLVMKNSSYHQVARDVILARTASFGWLYNLSSKPVPLPERFFAGGNTTNRGFPENQAGPRDSITGFPIGGDAFLFFGTELRFPVLGKTLGGVLFHDMGNVYETLSDISFRVRQHDRQDFNYMVHSVGIGFRYRTPVGPVRVDFGYSPNSPRFTGYTGTREDLINGATQLTVPQRVNPFQFFFSLGQTF